MNTLDVEQGTLKWMQARLGMPTASQYDRLLTPKTRKPSGGRAKYRAELLAEWLLGQPTDWGSTNWTERGTDMEAEARRDYEFQNDVEVQQVGFITRDDGKTGGSPDGLIGDDGILEIKCPNATQHVQYMLGDDPDYIGQCQGLMYLTGREWVHILSYNPELPPALNAIFRDDDYIAALVPVLDEFIGKLDEERERLEEHRVVRPWDYTFAENQEASA